MRRERIEHYRIEGLLGVGGMGEVWSAFDEKLERRVAIKILPEERASDDARGRMLREARAAGALHHPGIVPIYDTGEIDGLSYIVMEWVEGETLAARLERSGPLPPGDALELVAQAADALGAAHDAGIVHRDVKAANLMVDARGRVRVLDFGLSKRLGASSLLDSAEWIDPVAATVAPPGAAGDGWALATDRTLPATPAPGSASSPVSSRGSREPVTAFGSRMGTPGYAAPELIAGADADARSDVFSLAVVLYELIAGARPFPADTWGELERAMRAGPAPLSEASKGAVGSAFDAAIARGLAPRRLDRFATVHELTDVVRAAMAPPRPTRWRRAWLYAGGAALVLAGGAAIVLASSGASSRGPAPSDPPGPPKIPAPAPPPTKAPALFAGAPRPLTSLGGCAEGPIFADDRTVVFDLSRDGAVGLWAVGRDGKDARAIATGAGWQWRAAPGRTPGEVLYVSTDMDDETKSAVIAIDAATGAERARFPQLASSAAVAGGAIYFAVRDGAEIRRRTGDRDESWLTLPSELSAQQIVMSPRNVVAFTTVAPGAPGHLCTAAPGAPPTCLAKHTSAGRPEFSRDGAALYFDGAEGVFRHDLATGRDDLILPGARAPSGIGIAPDGKSLAYSECNERTIMADVSKPDDAIVDDPHSALPVFGPGGQLAWVHQEPGGERLELRRKDGTIVELVPPKFGRLTGLAFDAAGDRIAFVAGGDHPGVHVAVTKADTTTPPITQLTDGATDYNPQFTRDGRIVFTRVDDRNVSHVFSVSIDGGPAVQTSPTSRAVRAADLATGRVLITSGEHIVWWDPITDRSSAPVAGPNPARQIAVSPNGRWLLVQSGAAGLTFWRGPTADPSALEKVAELPMDGTVDSAAIDDDGRIVAPISRWSGELEIVDAAPGVTL